MSKSDMFPILSPLDNANEICTQENIFEYIETQKINKGIASLISNMRKRNIQKIKISNETIDIFSSMLKNISLFDLSTESKACHLFSENIFQQIGNIEFINFPLTFDGMGCDGKCYNELFMLSWNILDALTISELKDSAVESLEQLMHPVDDCSLLSLFCYGQNCSEILQEDAGLLTFIYSPTGLNILSNNKTIVNLEKNEVAVLVGSALEEVTRTGPMSSVFPASTYSIIKSNEKKHALVFRQRGYSGNLLDSTRFTGVSSKMFRSASSSNYNRRLTFGQFYKSYNTIHRNPVSRMSPTSDQSNDLISTFPSPTTTSTSTSSYPTESPSLSLIDSFRNEPNTTNTTFASAIIDDTNVSDISYTPTLYPSKGIHILFPKSSSSCITPLHDVDKKSKIQLLFYYQYHNHTIRVDHLSTSTLASSFQAVADKINHNFDSRLKLVRVDDLQRLCQLRGLPTTGSKFTLIDRLAENEQVYSMEELLFTYRNNIISKLQTPENINYKLGEHITVNCPQTVSNTFLTVESTTTAATDNLASSSSSSSSIEKSEVEHPLLSVTFQTNDSSLQFSVPMGTSFRISPILQVAANHFNEHIKQIAVEKYSIMNIKSLKQVCREKNLVALGLKSEIIEKLVEKEIVYEVGDLLFTYKGTVIYGSQTLTNLHFIDGDIIYFGIADENDH